MKKIIFTILSVLIATSAILAQDISVGKASINKTDRPVVMAKYTMPAAIVMSALKAKLKEDKISKSGKAKGGFRVYKGVSVPALSDDMLDIYTKVSGKKENSTLYMAVSRGYDNFVSADSDSAMMGKIKSYVKGLVGNINIEKIKIDIAAQAKVVKKADNAKASAEKTGKKLISEQKDLEKRIASNKSKQEDNKKAQASTAKKLQEEDAVLSELKAKMQMMLKK